MALPLVVSSRCAIEVLESRIAPASFLVINSNDSGPGSLRQAIINADKNGAAEDDIILFAIPEDVSKTILLDLPLPTVSSRVAIDATSQPGFAGVPLIAIDGSNLKYPGVDGIVLGGSAVKGLSIHGFTANGVRITSADAMIQSNWIGLDLTGAPDANGGSGIFVENSSARVKIGGDGAHEGNVLSGNGRYGVEVLKSSAVTILENNIGTNPAGDSALGNEWGGILSKSVTATISRNLVSGNDGPGLDITVSGGTVFNIAKGSITGNVIGLNVSGSAALPNSGDGLRVQFDATLTPIVAPYVNPTYISGSALWISENVLSGNLGSGAVVTGAKVTIEKNKIGLTTEGSTPIGNEEDGMRVQGTHFAISENVVSGNGGDGLDIIGTDIDVSKNKIGTNATGTSAVPNRGNGILANVNSKYETLPNPSVFDSNLIAHNHGAGIALTAGIATLTANSIFSNNGFGIDLGNDGITPNDLGDADTGPNGRLNFPVLSSATFISSGLLQVAGKFDGEPNTTNIIEFFSNPNSDNEAQVYLGKITVITDAQGTAEYGAELSINSGSVPQIVATATRLSSRFDGYVGEVSWLDGTSEISLPIPVRPAIGVGNAQVHEGLNGVSQLVFEVTLPIVSTEPVSVDFATVDGTATSGIDYLSKSGTLTFAPGETFKTVTIDIIDDELIEPNELMHLKLSNPAGAPIGKDSGSGFILNDDSPSTPVLSISDVSIIAPGTFWDNRTLTDAPLTRPAVFTVTLDSPQPFPVSVNFSTVAGTASFAYWANYMRFGDFEANSGILTFQPGETTKTIEVQVLGGKFWEGDETFSVNLSNPSGGTIIGDGTGTGTIIDPNSRITIFASSTPEGADTIFTLTLETAMAHPVTLDFKTIAGTATAGVDFTSIFGSLTFAPGETVRTISVPTLKDSIAEDLEEFQLELTHVVGAKLIATDGTLVEAGTFTTSILDVPSLTLSIAGTTVEEGLSGSKNAVFRVALDAASTVPVQVSYADKPITATPGTDYQAISGTLTFAPGETEKFIVVPIYGDMTAESAESFLIVLSSASGASLGNTAAVGTIVNATTAPLPQLTLSIAGTTVEEGLSGSKNAVFRVALDSASTVPVQVSYADQPITATRGTDYQAISGTLTFAPGETEKFIVVPIYGDMIAESAESFSIMLSSASGASLGNTAAVGTIVNATAPLPQLTLSIAGTTVEEGLSGSKNAVFRVALDSANTVPVQVSYADQPITATRGTDYQAISGTLTFAPGETEKFIVVPIYGDMIAESAESFSIMLSSASGASLGNYDAIGTIVNAEGVTLTVSANHKRATWTDADGDLVVLTSTKPALYAELFRFEHGENGPVLAELETRGKTALKFKVQQQPGGDGLVNVDSLRAASLTQLILPGRLGSLHVGTADSSVVIQSIVVDSFGTNPSLESGTSLTSEVYGKIGRFVVAKNFTNAELAVHGEIALLALGDDLLDTGLMGATGILAKNIGQLRVGGNIAGSDGENRVLIHAGEIGGASASPKSSKNLHSRQIEAIKSISIGGDLENTDIVSAISPGSSSNIGRVSIQGDWTASNLLAGAEAGDDGLFGTEDDVVSTASRIARIIVGGTVQGTTEAENSADRYAIAAGQIASLSVGKTKVLLSSKQKDSYLLSGTGDAFLTEW